MIKSKQKQCEILLIYVNQIEKKNTSACSEPVKKFGLITRLLCPL